MHQHYGILAVLPGSRCVQFMAYADDAQIVLERYGELILTPESLGPHILRIDRALDFAIAVDEVGNLLQAATPQTRSVGEGLHG